MSPKRRLLYRFFGLSWASRIEIGHRLGLTSRDDAEMTDNERVGLIFRRAVEQGKLSELWRAVERCYPVAEREGDPDGNTPWEVG